MGRFHDDTAVTKLDESLWRGEIREGWRIGAVPNGGYVLSIGARALSEALPQPDLNAYRAAVQGYRKTDEVTVPPRDAATFRVPAGGAFRITSVEGPQVGDMNLWNAGDLSERFFSGKTRALHGTHVNTGDRLWSNLPFMRPMSTIIEDTLDWYGFDEFGGVTPPRVLAAFLPRRAPRVRSRARSRARRFPLSVTS